MNRTGWVQDRLTAAVAWARLTGPADEVAAAVREHLGVQQALDCVLTGHLPGCRMVGDHRACAPGGTGSRTHEQALERWRARLPVLDPERDLALTEQVGARILLPGDPDWPPTLDDLGTDRPTCVWVRGRLPEEPAVAVVGSRTSTPYGRSVAADLAVGLTRHGHHVVSGAAVGIDAAAHRGALSAPGATTAVLACGIDRVYPPAHRDLLEQIAQEGAVISESPPGATPMRWRFLQRNRIIAALCEVTVVVEAAWRSGALNTAKHAGDLNRHVAAVPGPVTSAASAGCHKLLREGATCVTGPDDVRELVAPLGTVPGVEPRSAPQPQDGLAPVDLQVWEVLPGRRGLTVGQVAVGAAVSVPQARAALGRLAGLGLAACGRAGAAGPTWRRTPQTTRTHRQAG